MRHPLPPAVNVLAIVSPLTVVAAAVLLAWPWWAAVLASAVAVAVVAELTGLQSGVVSAMLATSGVALVVERDRPTDLPGNGIELVAMAALLMIALVFGVRRPID